MHLSEELACQLPVNIFLKEMIVSIAKKSDELFLFKLKNDIKVRKNSLKNKKISLSEHKKWFNKRLKERPNIYLFLAKEKKKN